MGEWAVGWMGNECMGRRKRWHEYVGSQKQDFWKPGNRLAELECKDKQGWVMLINESYYSKNPDLHFIGIRKPLSLLFNLSRSSRVLLWPHCKPWPIRKPLVIIIIHIINIYAL